MRQSASLHKAPPYVYSLAALLLVCYMTLVPNPVPGGGMRLFAGADKVAHFVMFGALAAALVYDSWRYSGRVSGLRTLLICFVVTAFGGAVELLQMLMDMGRSADWLDFAADAAGAFAAGYWARWMLRPLPAAAMTEGDVSLENHGSASSWLEQIKRLYEESFPPEERRPWGSILRLLDTVGSPFGLYVVCRQGDMAGFITTWTFDDFVYVEHFAVLPSMRGSGIGARALRLLARSVRKPVVLEVEPRLTGQMAQRRIEFYKRCGFHEFDEYKYVQPPYGPGLPAVELTLMSNSERVNLDEVTRKLHTAVYGVGAPAAPISDDDA